jgi:hypothetical protein
VKTTLRSASLVSTGTPVLTLLPSRFPFRIPCPLD